MLPWPQRLYFWGMHGIFAEVMYTAIREFMETGDKELKGVSTIWALLVYALGTILVVEPVRETLVCFRVPLLARCIIYVVMMRLMIYVVFTFTWEYTCGAFVGCLFNWEHSEEFAALITGMIAMEHIPMWILASLCFEGIYAIMKSSASMVRCFRTNAWYP